MLVLGIDTSTKVGGLGLFDSEKGLVGECNLALDQTHSQRLMPVLKMLVEMSGFTVQDLDGISITLGPGSFTGTRIGVTTAKTLAQVGEKPIVGVSTLEVTAANLAYVSGMICPIFDARNRRVYTALFEGNSSLDSGVSSRWMSRLTDDDSCTIDELMERLVGENLSDQSDSIFFVGDAVSKYQELIREKLGERVILPCLNDQIPKGGMVAELGAMAFTRGQRADLFALAPNYLKPSQAEINWQKKHGK